MARAREQGRLSRGGEMGEKRRWWEMGERGREIQQLAVGINDTMGAGKNNIEQRILITWMKYF